VLRDSDWRTLTPCSAEARGGAPLCGDACTMKKNFTITFTLVCVAVLAGNGDA
jgi:hypothetical protein